MSSYRRLAFALIAAAIFVAPKPVRGQDFSGTYTTEIPVRIENHGGSESVSETATATITLTQTGETVTGTWQMEALPDRPSPAPRTLSGSVQNGKLILTDTMEAQIRRGGELPMTVQMINTMELTLDGENLTGTQFARSADGSISASPRPINATRARS